MSVKIYLSLILSSYDLFRTSGSLQALHNSHVLSIYKRRHRFKTININFPKTVLIVITAMFETFEIPRSCYSSIKQSDIDCMCI